MSRTMLLGGGGRESAIADALTRWGHSVYAFPGNPGIRQMHNAWCINTIALKDHYGLGRYAHDNQIDLIVVGPEAPLADGFADYGEKMSLRVVGSKKAQARLETSKTFCCRVAQEASVLLPPNTRFYTREEFLPNGPGLEYPYVAKYDGLAAGKGVRIIRNRQQELEALEFFRALPPAGFVTQDLVVGQELSAMYLTDGLGFKLLGSAADYKELFKGGPMTGGMGGFAPNPLYTPDMQSRVEQRVVVPLLRQVKIKTGENFRGFMYVQLMIVDGEPVLIEINCRLGDPEAQLILPTLDVDPYPLFLATTQDGVLETLEVRHQPLKTVGFVLASKGYPDQPVLNEEIRIEPETKNPLTQGQIFHAGTKVGPEGRLLTAGGRVITVKGTGLDFTSARAQALYTTHRIKFDGMQMRRDIAQSLVAEETYR